MKPLLLVFSCLPLVTYAIKIPVRQVRRHSFASTKRDSFGDVHITDNGDLLYIANINIANQTFPVQLDTGSSDLWVSTNGAALGNNSGLKLNLTYGIGYAAGYIATADVKLAGLGVPSQAYLEATDVNNPVIQYGAHGIAGLGFTSLSSIASAVDQTNASWGASLLYNIFAQNTSEPNIISFALQRDTDPGQDVQGAFTIGELVTEYADVAKTAPIPTFPPHNPTRWTIVVDKIIASGKELSLKTAVQGAPSDKAVALLDTGTSLAYAPEHIVTQIYSSIPGASFSQSLGKWIAPCDEEVDISLVIDGRQFDLDPLDALQPSTTGGTTCVGSWLPQTIETGKSDFDLLLGDAVLRSMYTLFNFGDFDSNHNMGDPYVKLLSLVIGANASVEYHKVRGGLPNNSFISNPGVNSANANTLDSSVGTANVEDLKNKVDEIMKWAPVALGLAALNLLVLLVGFVAVIMSCCRRRKTRAQSGSFIPLPLAGSSADTQYRPVSQRGLLHEDT